MVDVRPDILERLRPICLELPETYEEPAWVGVRWRVRKRTFAHVVTVEDGSDSVFARMFPDTGAFTCVTFRAPADEIAALSSAGPPFFYAGWGRDVVGLRLDHDTDWVEVRELMTDSFCVLAPAKLIARLPGL